ncbi:MAG: hypothetical protein PVI24_01190 [Myxococcales bacterium]
MARAGMWCVAALWLLGCQSGEEPVRGANQGVEPARQYQPAPQAQPVPRDTPTPEPAAPPVIVEQREQPPKRDLANELRAALGVPIDCVQDFQASRPTTIRIGIQATVRPTGMIIDPSAYGAGLSRRELQCIEQRVGLVVLQPLDETNSETVSTVVDINYEPPVIVESRAGTPEPRLQGVVEPLPKKPTLPRSGTPIEITEGQPIEGGKPTERPIQGPPGKKITGPKPVPIEGYEVDENSENWSR